MLSHIPFLFLHVLFFSSHPTFSSRFFLDASLHLYYTWTQNRMWWGAKSFSTPPLQPTWLNEISFWKLFWVTEGNMNGVIRGNFEIPSRTLKFTIFYSIFFTFFRMYILWVKVMNFKVLVAISKISLMTPFIFPQVTQNNFQWEISVSQYGCRGGC